MVSFCSLFRVIITIRAGFRWHPLVNKDVYSTGLKFAAVYGTHYVSGRAIGCRRGIRLPYRAAISWKSYHSWWQSESFRVISFKVLESCNCCCADADEKALSLWFLVLFPHRPNGSSSSLIILLIFSTILRICTYTHKCGINPIRRHRQRFNWRRLPPTCWMSHPWSRAG